MAINAQLFTVGKHVMALYIIVVQYVYGLGHVTEYIEPI